MIEKFKRLNELFKSNVNGFWREIKKIRKIKQLINIPIEQIKKQYTTLFNSSNFPDEKRDKKEKEELDKKIQEFNENKTENDYIKLTNNSVHNVINNLKNGKAN